MFHTKSLLKFRLTRNSTKLKPWPSTLNRSFLSKRKYTSQSKLTEPRESDETDVIIVGGGPSGLSAAIRIKQLCQETGQDIRVCLIEKGAAVGMSF